MFYYYLFLIECLRKPVKAGGGDKKVMREGRNIMEWKGIFVEIKLRVPSVDQEGGTCFKFGFTIDDVNFLVEFVTATGCLV